MLIYSPVTLNTIYEIASPKYNSPAWLPLLFSWLNTYNWLFDISIWRFHRHIKLKIQNVTVKVWIWLILFARPSHLPCLSKWLLYVSYYSRNKFSSHLWILLLTSYIWFDKNAIDFSNKPWILPLTTSTATPRSKHLYPLLRWLQNTYNWSPSFYL